MEFSEKLWPLADAEWTGAAPEFIMEDLWDETDEDDEHIEKFVAITSQGLVFVFCEGDSIRREIIEWYDIDECLLDDEDVVSGELLKLDICTYGGYGIIVDQTWFSHPSFTRENLKCTFEKYRRRGENDVDYWGDDDFENRHLTRFAYLSLLKDLERATLIKSRLGIVVDFYDWSISDHFLLALSIYRRKKCDYQLLECNVAKKLALDFVADELFGYAFIREGKSGTTYLGRDKYQLLENMIALLKQLNDTDGGDVRSAYFEYAIRHVRNSGDDSIRRNELLMKVLKPEFLSDKEVIVCTETGIEFNMESAFDLTDGTKDHLPLVVDAKDLLSVKEGLIFDGQQPENGKIYFRHPYDLHRYYGVAEYNEMVFKSKFYELFRLLKSLGAFSISGSLTYTTSQRERTDAEKSLSAGGEKGGFEIEATHKSERSNGFTVSLLRELKQSSTFMPTEAPHIPSGLSFLPTEPLWRELAQEILAGRRTSCEIELSCKDTQNFDKKKCDSIDASLKAVVASLKFAWTETFQQSKENMEEMVITLKADFRDSNGHRATDYKKINEGEITDSERVFLEYAKTLIRNKECGAPERESLLDTKADRLGIDPLRATELTNLATVLID